MKKTPDQPGDSRRPRLKKETLRGLGFAELDQVHGGVNDDHGKPIKKPFLSRNCLTG